MFLIEWMTWFFMTVIFLHLGWIFLIAYRFIGLDHKSWMNIGWSNSKGRSGQIFVDFYDSLDSKLNLKAVLFVNFCENLKKLHRKTFKSYQTLKCAKVEKRSTRPALNFFYRKSYQKYNLNFNTKNLTKLSYPLQDTSLE